MRSFVTPLLNKPSTFPYRKPKHEIHHNRFGDGVAVLTALVKGS